MVDNIPKNEYNQKLYDQKQLQTRLIEASRKRREEEALIQEEGGDPEEIYEQDRQQTMFGTHITSGYRISFTMAWMLFVSALLVDLAEMIITWLGLVVVGGLITSIISTVAAVLFGVWFSILNVNQSSNTKVFFTGLVTVLIEILPFIDLAPILAFAWSGGMIITVGLVRMEDRGEEPTIQGAIREFSAMSSVQGFIYSKIKHRGKPVQKIEEGVV